MKRDIAVVNQTVKAWTVSASELVNLKDWLLEQAFDDRLLILAHADDGVIWGKMDRAAKTLVTSVDRFPGRALAALRAETLQTCRLFGRTGEVMLWRSGNGWRARKILDGTQPGEPVQYFDEAQILWGTQVEANGGDFTLVSDGAQGLMHAVPMAVTEIPFDRPDAKPFLKRPLRLTMRHYLAQNDDGMVIISGSRLVDLSTEPKKRAR